MKYTVVDVRTKEEFAGGNVAGSINIPLQEIAQREAEIMALETPILFCCASGGRSGQATAFFQGKDLECENGGGWMEANAKVNS
ncbi:MAG: rhodanese-like domain-containing protein [Crocinitomicaceae bacterium]|nr:rhodanese-like domain-containing protein [Crocinitomicaceae bacterium]